MQLIDLDLIFSYLYDVAMVEDPVDRERAAAEVQELLALLHVHLSIRQILVISWLIEKGGRRN